MGGEWVALWVAQWDTCCCPFIYNPVICSRLIHTSDVFWHIAPSHGVAEQAGEVFGAPRVRINCSLSFVGGSSALIKRLRFIAE